MEKSVFRLRKAIQCHSMDIRSVASFPGHGFVTASRDRLCKVFLPQKTNADFIEAQCFVGAQHYVSCVCVLHDEDTAESIVFAGSNDAIIYAFTIDKSESNKELLGHSGTVCSLTADNKNGLIASGSWDNTAIVWKDCKSVCTLVGHEAAVWGTAFIVNELLTASADKTLKLWDIGTGKCKVTFTGHSDCVRGITVLSEDQFLSCSNDATVRQWKKSGEPIATFYGHDNFIYSISSFYDHKFVTCSEDRTVRIWNQGQVEQTIRLPAPTLWSVVCFDDNNFVVGASNGKVYVFTRDPNLQASAEEQQELEQEVSKSVLPMSELGDIKISELPEKEVLLAPGKKEGQTKLVREGQNVSVYQWSCINMMWTKVGDVVGAAGTSKDPSQKVLYEGKEYDYVFDVDIQEGVPPLKLPYNVTENPWKTAQDFIHKHNLSQLYLDQIANFIIKNTKGMVVEQASSMPSDPFTGSGRYVPDTSATANGVFATDSEYFPQKSYLFFETANIEGIARKLKEFSELVPPDVKITAEDIKLLLKLSDLSAEATVEQIALIKLLISWPKQYIFPALDLLRLSVLLPKVTETLCTSKDSIRLLDTLLIYATDSSSTPNQMLSLRTLCNLFSHQLGQAFMVNYSSTIFKALGMSNIQTTHKNVQIALSTIFLNYAVYLSTDSNTALKMECLSSITFIIKEKIDGEAMFRLLVALGTLLSDKQLLNLSKSEELYNLIANLKTCTNPEKVGKCAEKICKLLRSS
ncbi:phospholipase A-2-activating protein-like protein [Dinothrombium tinctorium]|uniref:Phospholipase A-2-activating protein-like protein n=1 Tax=Dinothrombium tinctorium TaxID=1965070 RepID=A0A3S3SPI2_9ACAR|nr:phospholipase A-2-activating protein-like protein [Dinothrombium tinctorium]